ncbi:MAG TPA: hypothetical protein VLL27_11905, partial [Solirubrobacterales bacterium]|nr:hypothetical protein [Solirubrobacterales bacterium]
MNSRKTIIGLAVLCALVVSAFAAQAASAVGTTGYTCKETPGTGTFKAGHCKPSDAGAGNFSHVAYGLGTTTELLATDANTAGEHTGAVLKSTVSGSAVELVAKEVSGAGTTANSEVGGEMVASGEGPLKYSGVSEKLLGCKVTGKPGGAGVVETKQLFASTAGVGDKLKFTPKEGTVFAEFELTECAVGPTTVKVVGSVLGVPDGATTNTT